MRPTMCYCDKEIIEICKDLLCERIPSEALTKDCCWKRICKARSETPVRVSPRMWKELCKQRATLRYVQYATGTITGTLHLRKPPTD